MRPRRSSNWSSRLVAALSVCGVPDCGFSVCGVPDCGLSVCGVSVCGVSVCGLSVCGVSVCGVSVCVLLSQPSCRHAKVKTDNEGADVTSSCGTACTAVAICCAHRQQASKWSAKAVMPMRRSGSHRRRPRVSRESSGDRSQPSKGGRIASTPPPSLRSAGK